jgi:uracil phosphoribosyltransferase
MSSITVVSHPIVQSKISELRNSHTSSHRFRALVKEITTVVGIEATRNLPLKDVQGVSGLRQSLESVAA